MGRPDPSATEAGLTDYEIQRKIRMESNAQFLEELGLSDKQPALAPPRPSQKRVRKVMTANYEAVGVRRRSERLQTLPAPLYSSSNAMGETDAPPKRRKTGVSLRRRADFVEKVEEYTPEDMKLLGTFERPWVLNIDGYKEGGQKALDPVNGKTCHQCRQKSLGKRTGCRCGLTQGQFCGDCLYTRYGENVEEASRKEGWVCPPCRGICNCSICRDRRGWPPTGQLWHQASRAGYPSVAHYLISTKQKVQVDSAEMTPEPQPTSGGNNSVPRGTTKSSSRSSGVGAQEVNPCADEKGGIVGQEKPQVIATVQTRKGIQRKVKKYFRGIKPTSAIVQTTQKSGAGEKNKAGLSHTTPQIRSLKK